MASKSLWMDVDVMPAADALDGDGSCDVVVIGSGIAGISTAYELSQRGRSVIVIDRKRIAGGMTPRTSAHLAPLCDDFMSEFRKIRGSEAARATIGRLGLRRSPRPIGLDKGKHRDVQRRLAGLGFDRLENRPRPWPKGVGR